MTNCLNYTIMVFKVRNGGVRRYQNPDGSLTEAGKRRYRGMSSRISRLEIKKQEADNKSNKYQTKFNKAVLKDDTLKAYKTSKVVKKNTKRSLHYQKQIERRTKQLIEDMKQMTASDVKDLISSSKSSSLVSQQVKTFIDSFDVLKKD